VTAHIEAASPHTMNTYARLPIAMDHGQGCYVWDVNGKRYLDGLGGIAVNTLGHNHPKLVPALQDQIGKIIHSSNYYHVPNAEVLAKKLTELSGLTNVFFCCTGLEANEAALKLARKFGHDKGIANPQIVVYEKAFHGRSIATLSATGNPKIQKGFEPLVEGFIRVPLNDLEALKKATEGNRNVVAVFFETIQGEGGINPMRADYLKQVRALCDEKDWLLMIDEVQCGMGRTGKWFAHQWADIKPDVMPLAKGLGSGVPIGAVVAGPKAANIFQPGNHGTTFGGNPLAMRAGVEADLAALDGNGGNKDWHNFADPMQACEGADLVTTDVWTSMGYEAENEARKQAFADWCVDAEMMAAAKPDALFMHCLPAHRGEEVTADVIDGPQSVVWDEAENRMHVQKALMEYLLLGRLA
jgi:acetylornithine/N-succinyldiaminopimelate aminotransferase